MALDAIQQVADHLIAQVADFHIHKTNKPKMDKKITFLNGLYYTKEFDSCYSYYGYGNGTNYDNGSGYGDGTSSGSGNGNNEKAGYGLGEGSGRGNINCYGNNDHYNRKVL